MYGVLFRQAPLMKDELNGSHRPERTTGTLKFVAVGSFVTSDPWTNTRTVRLILGVHTCPFSHAANGNGVVALHASSLLQTPVDRFEQLYPLLPFAHEKGCVHEQLTTVALVVPRLVCAVTAMSSTCNAAVRIGRTMTMRTRQRVSVG